MSPTSTLKLITSGVLSKAISFFGDKVSFLEFPDCCSPLPLKKNGSLLVIPLDGGEVIVEVEDAVDSYKDIIIVKSHYQYYILSINRFWPLVLKRYDFLT